MRVAVLLVTATVLLGCDEHKPRPIDDCGSDCVDAAAVVDAGATLDAGVEPDADAGDAGDGGDT